MKNRCLTLFVSILALFCFSTSTQAQDLVFTGAVVGVSPDAGTMVLSNGPDLKMTLTGLHQARIRAVDGRLFRLNNLRPGMRVSVAYLQQGQQRVVSRILVPAEAQPEVMPMITDPRSDRSSTVTSPPILDRRLPSMATLPPNPRGARIGTATSLPRATSELPIRRARSRRRTNYLNRPTARRGAVRCGFGFGLYRRLATAGAPCYVIAPRKLDEHTTSTRRLNRSH
jgi:hypothetical protein